MTQFKYPVSSFSDGDGRVIPMVWKRMKQTFKGIREYRVSDFVLILIFATVWFFLDFLDKQGIENGVFRVLNALFSSGRVDFSVSLNTFGIIIARLIVFNFVLSLRYQKIKPTLLSRQIIYWLKSVFTKPKAIVFLGLLTGLGFLWVLTSGFYLERSVPVIALFFLLAIEYDQYEGTILGLVQRIFAAIKLPSNLLNELVSGWILSTLLYFPSALLYRSFFQTTYLAADNSYALLFFLNIIVLLFGTLLQLGKLSNESIAVEKFFLVISIEGDNQVRPGEAPIKIFAKIISKEDKTGEKLNLANTNQLKITCSDPYVVLENEAIASDGKSVMLSVKPDAIIDPEKKINLRFGFKNRAGYLKETHEIELMAYPSIELKHPHFYCLAGSGTSYELPFKLQNFKKSEIPILEAVAKEEGHPFEVQIDSKKNIIKVMDLGDENALEQAISFYAFELIASTEKLETSASFSVGVCKEGAWADFLGEPPIVYDEEKTYVSVSITEWNKESLRLDHKAPDLVVVSFKNEKDGENFLELEPSWHEEINQIKDDATVYSISLQKSPQGKEPVYGKLMLSAAVGDRSYNTEIGIAAMKKNS